MTRTEWGLILALSLITVLTLSFAPPVVKQESLGAPAEAQLTASATAAPSSTAIPPTLRATLTGTPTNTPTRTRQASPTATPTATLSPTPSSTPTATPYPFDTRADLERYVYIDQLVQHMYIFERGKLVRDIPCSMGLPEKDKYTPAWSGKIGYYVGTFFAFEVYADDAWYLFDHDGGILIHSLPYTLQNGYKVYQDRDALGVRPASHGCVRIAPEEAKWFVSWKPEGASLAISDPHLEYWKWVLRK